MAGWCVKCAEAAKQVPETPQEAVTRTVRQRMTAEAMMAATRRMDQIKPDVLVRHNAAGGLGGMPAVWREE